MEVLNKNIETDIGQIIKNYGKVMSLGYNCFPKKFIKKIGIEGETHFFDNIGSSMWSINKLIKNGFNGLGDKMDYRTIEIEPTMSLRTHREYYLRFIHDFTLDEHIKKYKNKDKLFGKRFGEKIDKVIEIYERRGKRFLSTLCNCEKNGEKVLFLRLEEKREKRILYEAYSEHFKKSELEHIHDFFNLIHQSYPNLEFKIIFISYSLQTTYDPEHHLIILYDTNQYTWDNCDQTMLMLFKHWKNRKIEDSEENLIKLLK